MSQIPFIPYNTSLKTFSQQHRKHMTKSEGLVWHCILKNNKTGYRRLRQKPIGNYILDFYCAKLKLCIEIDGSSHDNKQDDDATRDYILYHDYGITTIRYTSEQVEYNLSGVFDDILERCQKKSQH